MTTFNNSFNTAFNRPFSIFNTSFNQSFNGMFGPLTITEEKNEVDVLQDWFREHGVLINKKRKMKEKEQIREFLYMLLIGETI